MPVGQLYIYDDGQYRDAFSRWGVSFEDNAVSNLMAFPEMKSYITNSSRLEHGKSILNINPKFASRAITLEMHIVAPNYSTFLERLYDFTTLLSKGEILMKTSFMPEVVFHLYYVSCTQFTQFDGLAKFTLRFEEPNPMNRS